jgi:hypothetical protein
MRGSAVRSQLSLVVQEQVPAGHVSARGDAPGGFSLDASVMTWVRPDSLSSLAMGLPDLQGSRDLMHGRTGGSLRTGSLGSKILGMGEKRKGKSGSRRHHCPSPIFHPQQNVTMGHDMRVMFSAM